MRLASSRSLVLCDLKGTANLEWLEDAAWVFGGEIVHTNHFLSGAFSRRDAINVFARNSSVRRLQACRDALRQRPGARSADDHFEVLATHPICVHADGNIRRESTVAAVVMKPRDGKMYVRSGPPCLARTCEVPISGRAGA